EKLFTASLEKHSASSLRKLGADPALVEQRGNRAWRSAWTTSDSGYYSCWCDVSARRPEFTAFFRSLRLSAPVQSQLASIEGQLAGEPFIGVHFRGTDGIKGPAKAQSLAALQSRLRRYDRATRFFLATDSGGAREAITAALPGRVVCQDVELESGDSDRLSPDRATLPGMQAAAVDMFALAACREIVCNVPSTFSECASYIRGARLIKLTKTRQ
ncbi:MAG: hypothetical protein KDA41_22675, partial [Planctomycetales bacterium]|nr:hypothetical protein [Planctomycetales bacterium]